MSVHVYITRRAIDDSVEIFLMEKRPDGKFSVAEPVQMLFSIHDEVYTIKPTMILSGPWGRQILNAFAEALDHEGIKTDKDAKIAGTLEATRYHLEDLRKLLKLTGVE